MKKILKILAVVLYFIVFCYMFMSMFYAIYRFFKSSMQYSFVLFLKGSFIGIWKQIPNYYKHEAMHFWFRDYGVSLILSFFVALAVLLIICRKWVMKQARRFTGWFKNKKGNSKASRIKRLEEEVEQLKKGE